MLEILKEIPLIHILLLATGLLIVISFGIITIIAIYHSSDYDTPSYFEKEPTTFKEPKTK